MRRTQLYLDKQIFILLGIISERTKLTISELVRRAVEKVYKLERDSKSLLEMLNRTSGILKGHKDIKNVDRYVRSFRSGRRAHRLKLS